MRSTIPLGATITDAQGNSYRLTEDPPRQGGQADVFRATARDGRAVAIKLYREQAELALVERRILDAVRAVDPHAEEWLLTVLGHGEANGRPFMVFPWMPETVASWCKGRALAERLDVLERSAAAVARLHRSTTDLAAYRVHRDIKPTNLLVAMERGHLIVRLADLGAAKEGGVLDDTENTGVLTRYFAPPEQALPLDRPPSESWDVHALAVTVFHTLTGKMPAPAIQAQNLLNDDGLTLIELSGRARHGSPLTPGDRRHLEALRARAPETLLELEDTPGWRADDQHLLENTLLDGLPAADPAAVARVATRLGDTMARALDPDPRRREASARPLLAAIREVRALLEAAQRPPGSGASQPFRPGRSETSQRVKVAILALVAVAGAGGLGLAMWSRQGPAPAAPPPPSTEPEPPEPPEPVKPPVSPVSTPLPGEDPSDITGGPPKPPRVQPKVPIKVPISEPSEQSPIQVIEVRTFAVNLDGCPIGDLHVRVDDVDHDVPADRGLNIDLTEGPHTLVWTLRTNASATPHTRSIQVSGPTRICENFNGGVCASCR